MRISGLNHFNVVTDDLEKSAKFYESLGLERGRRPDFGNSGIWLYIDDEPKVHLNLKSEIEAIKGPLATGHGTVDHLGFDVHGHMDDICAALMDLGISFKLWPTPVAGWYRALYFKGPSGEEIEFVLRSHYVGAAAAKQVA